MTPSWPRRAPATICRMPRPYQWIISLLLLWLTGCVHAGAVNSESIEPIVATQLTTKALMFSPVFEGRGDGVHTCPVSGEKVIVKTAFKADYFGRTVYFCCEGCLKKAQRCSPAQYIKPTLIEQAQAVKAYVARVPEAPSGDEYCNE